MKNKISEKAKRKINSARREELKQLMQRLRAKGYTLDGIAVKSGYSRETLRIMMYRDAYQIAERPLIMLRSML